MPAHRESQKFSLTGCPFLLDQIKLILISDFNTKRDYKSRGYERCNPEGVDILSPNDRTGQRPIATSKFWRNRAGRLVVRFYSQGYDSHYEALLVSGKRISDDEMYNLVNYIMDVLDRWIDKRWFNEPPNSSYYLPVKRNVISTDTLKRTTKDEEKFPTQNTKVT